MLPFDDLNRFRYHDDWLRNLLIASSLNGHGNAQSLKHKLIIRYFLNAVQLYCKFDEFFMKLRFNPRQIKIFV
jgi:hypothetical protein